MVFTGLGSQFQQFPVKHQDFLKQRPTIFFLFKESLFLLSIFFLSGEEIKGDPLQALLLHSLSELGYVLSVFV